MDKKYISIISAEEARNQLFEDSNRDINTWLKEIDFAIREAVLNKHNHVAIRTTNMPKDVKEELASLLCRRDRFATWVRPDGFLVISW